MPEVRDSRRHKITTVINNLVASPHDNISNTSSAQVPHSHKTVDSNLPHELGKLIYKDVVLLKKLGWKKFITMKKGKGDFNNLHNLQHPAKHILQKYKTTGVPVVTSNTPLSSKDLDKAIHRGPHPSANNYANFLCGEFISMINKEQWIVLPYDDIKNIPNLRISPPGVVPQRDRRPRWIGDYTWSGVNSDTIDIAPMGSMQFGRALDRILRQIVTANPNLGPISIIKTDISDGFYRVSLRWEDIPKLALSFPHVPGLPPLVALPLRLPMGWKLSPPHFCATTETITDIANRNMKNMHLPTLPHHLSEQANTIDPESYSTVKPTTIPRDPNLPTATKPLAASEVFVDDIITIAQGNSKQLHKVRTILFHAIDEIFRPLNQSDSQHRSEPISTKKLAKGDCSWALQKLVLGWIIDTVASTITLPPHRVARLQEILASLPPSQKRTSLKNWHKILGELRSMAIALPGSKGLFSELQLALSAKKGGRINLSKGVHGILNDFRILLQDIVNRPTRLQELVPANPSIKCFHDASGKMAGGVLIPSHTIAPRNSSRHPIIWRCTFPPEVQKQLITDDNPHGTITNSDLELTAAIISNEAASQNFDVRERTILNHTDNSPTMYWLRKGSATTNSARAHLLRAQALHQRHHRYLAQVDFIPGLDNSISDISSRSMSLTDSQLISLFNSKYPQPVSWHIWNPPNKFLSAMTSCLLSKTFNMESLLQDPIKYPQTGYIGKPSATPWPSTPISPLSKTLLPSSRSMQGNAGMVDFPISGSQFEPAPLRMSYGLLAKRLPVWEPKIRARMNKARLTFA